MAEIRGRVMTIPHYCYDEGDDLPQFLMGKIAGNGNRTRMASLEGWNFTIKLCPHATVNVESVRE
jgi:hypothetical protein